MTIVTLENFDEMFALSLQRLDAYRLTQKTQQQFFDAKCRKHHVTTNERYFRYKVEHEPGSVYLCSRCGAMESAAYIKAIKDRMQEKQICFGCDLWEQRALESNPKRLVIEGHIYGDGGNSPGARSDFLGFGGAVWTIERDGHIWQTNNLWSGGTIPEEHRKQLPDNARFIR